MKTENESKNFFYTLQTYLIIYPLLHMFEFLLQDSSTIRIDRYAYMYASTYVITLLIGASESPNNHSLITYVICTYVYVYNS